MDLMTAVYHAIAVGTVSSADVEGVVDHVVDVVDPVSVEIESVESV